MTGLVGLISYIPTPVTVGVCGGFDRTPRCINIHEAYGPKPHFLGAAPILAGAHRMIITAGLDSRAMTGLQGEISEARMAVRGLLLTLSDAARTALTGLIERPEEGRPGVMGIAVPIVDDSAIHPTGHLR